MQIAGLPVKDATKPLNVKITERDCAKGANKDPGGCAAAVAIMRETHCTQARVHLGRVYIKKATHWLRYRTPQAIRSEIISFDRGAEFAPGDYTLAPMQTSHRASGKRRKIERPGTGHGKNNPRKRRAKPHVVYGVRQRGANR